MSSCWVCRYADQKVWAQAYLGALGFIFFLAGSFCPWLFLGIVVCALGGLHLQGQINYVEENRMLLCRYATEAAARGARRPMKVAIRQLKGLPA